MILSDVMFFLVESNQKYTFFSQDNKVQSHVYHARNTLSTLIPYTNQNTVSQRIVLT